MSAFVVAVSILFITAAWTPLGAQPTVTIGTWNLAGNNVPDLTENLLRQQARGIALFKPDVLVLAEVDSPCAIYQLADILREQEQLAYQAHIIDQPQTNIDIGILFTQGVQIGTTGLIAGVDLGVDNLRQAYWADVRIGQFDFRVIGVHLKSGGGEGVALRVAQAHIIADFLRVFLHFAPERDVLVLGDYNMFPKRDPEAFTALGTDGYLRFISSEVLCSGPQLQQCTGTHIQRSGPNARVGNLLDGFAIASAHTSEYQSDLRRVDLPQMMGLSLGDYKKNVTDHYPLVATFRATQDDDGQLSAPVTLPATAAPQLRRPLVCQES